jgi:phage gp37-like protein
MAQTGYTDVPIARIEDAIVDRLRLGLGKMVTSVQPYGGELDEKLPTVVRKFPAAWVTFAGVLSTKRMDTARVKHKALGRFSVMVGQRNLRNESAPRKGSARRVGTYQLIYAVRRLLTEQDLGLEEVGALQPGAIRTLFNGVVASDAVSVFALEFDVEWVELALENGRWPDPKPGDTEDPDILFPDHGGKTDEPYPYLDAVEVQYRLPHRQNTDPPNTTDVVKLNKD